MSETLTFTGRISKIHFSKGGFVIASLYDPKKKRTIRFKGLMEEPALDSRWQITGRLVEHPTFGPQIELESASLAAEDPLASLKAFFEQNFKGIGRASAEAIVDALGEDAIEQIADDPDVLISQCHLPHRRAIEVESRLKSLQKGPQSVIELLKMGLDQKEIDLLAEHKVPFDRLKEDPFGPYFDISGFTIDGSRKIAAAMHLPADDVRRLEAEIWKQLQEWIYTTGSTFWWIGALCEVMHLPAETLQPALDRLAGRAKITMEEDRVFPASFFAAECQIAHVLHLLSYPVDPPEAGRLEEIVSTIEARESITYDPLQKQAIMSFFEHSLMILNGGPGTGKSTVVRGILGAISKVYPNAKTLLCAPTGRAARRMSELSGHHASTIHSLLEWSYETGHFSRDRDNPVSCDFLIVDEFSMVDTRLFAALLAALPTTARVLLIGDEEQLESVGPGKVFNDLIDSGTIDIVRLQTLFRQKEGGEISALCEQIRNEKPLRYGGQVEFVQTRDGILQALKEHVEALEEPEAIQVLAPMYAGSQGIFAINTMMQELINPFDANKPQLIEKVRDSRGEREVVWRQGDKIMVLSNQAAAEMSNGDIGSIVEVDLERETVLIDVDGKQLEIAADARGGLITHGWCVSIHKAQGSEYRQACVIVDPAAARMLARRLLYTAVSRAKQQLLIIGDQTAFEQGCRTRGRSQRATWLKARLESTFAGASAIENEPESDYNAQSSDEREQ